jgi:hypothetical protein
MKDIKLHIEEEEEEEEEENNSFGCGKSCTTVEAFFVNFFGAAVFSPAP